MDGGHRRVHNRPFCNILSLLVLEKFASDHIPRYIFDLIGFICLEIFRRPIVSYLVLLSAPQFFFININPCLAHYPDTFLLSTFLLRISNSLGNHGHLYTLQLLLQGTNPMGALVM
jgi:hypothetical protein